MNVLRWLRSRRALIADLDAQADLINQQCNQLHKLAALLAESQASLVASLLRADEQSQRLADIRAQLLDLREQIRQLEVDAEPSRLYEPDTCPNTACIHHRIRHVHPFEVRRLPMTDELRRFIDADSRAERGEP